MEKSDFDNQVKKSIELKDLQQKYFGEYYIKWYKLSRLQKFCEILLFTGLCMVVWFILGCWGLLCENVFYENLSKDLLIVRVVITLLTCLVQQIIIGSIVFVIICIHECCKDNNRVYTEQGKSIKFNSCNCVLYLIICTLILLLYVATTSMEIYFQKDNLGELAPSLFTKESIPYTLCGILKPMPILMLTNCGFYKESDGSNSSNKESKKIVSVDDNII